MKFKILPTFIIIATLMGAARIYEFSLGVSEVIAQEQEADEHAAEEGADDPAAATVPVEAPQATSWSRSEIQVLYKLKARREEIEAQGRAMDLREKTLITMEAKIDKKILTLKNIEQQIANLVKQHDEQAQRQIASLVKTYSTMKPKKAALVFAQLNMDVQILLVVKMKEAKVAKILEQMDPKAAQKLTTELVNRRKMPLING